MFRRLLSNAAALAIMLLLSSCASISLVDTWHNPAVEARKYRKLLVASLSKEAETRKVIEDILGTELSRQGVDVTTGNAISHGKGTTNRQALVEMARKAGAEAVLTIQTIRVERETAIQPGYVNSFGTGFAPGWDYYGGFRPYAYYGTYGYGYDGYGPAPTWYEPPRTYSYDVATIQTNLFASEDGRLIWAATMETLEPGRLVKVGKDMARVVATHLAKEGLI